MTKQILEQIQERARDPQRQILLRGATVLSMDANVGDFATGDILIRGKLIAEVGVDLSQAGDSTETVVVDAAGMIAVPGFHDTHRHCWQGQLRRLIPDCDGNTAYLAVLNHWFGPLYTPADIYVGNLISALGALNSGITCLLDFFHNPRTPEHSDAAVKALADSGIRAVHTSCGPIGGVLDGSWPGDVARLRDTYFSSTDQLLTLRMGALGADFARPEIALGPDKINLARELGIALTSDGIGGAAASARVEALGDAGLLGPDVALIHCLSLSERAWQYIADSGVSVSIPTTSDAQIGLSEAIPVIQTALDHGIRPSLSVDVEVCLSSDMFTQMRTLLDIQRMFAFNKRYVGADDVPEPITTRDVLEFATVQGARANGLFDRTGTLTPGKEADIVLIRADDWNTMPLNNAYGTVVVAADTASVDTVFVAGEPRKWAGRLVEHELAKVRALIEESRDRLVAAAGYDLDVLNQTHGFVSEGR